MREHALSLGTSDAVAASFKFDLEETNGLFRCQSTKTNQKNSIIRFASPRRELLEALNESLVNFPGVVKLEKCSVWFLCSECMGETAFGFS